MAFVILRVLLVSLVVDWSQGAKQVWHLVDVPVVVCHDLGAPGYVELKMDKGEFDDPGQPFVISFMRSTERAVEIDFEMTDDRGQIILPSRTITLDDMDPSRQQDVWGPMPFDHTTTAYPLRLLSGASAETTMTIKVDFFDAQQPAAKATALRSNMSEHTESFTISEHVTWMREHPEVPRGTFGTVVGFHSDGQGVLVEFPNGTWAFTPSELQKVTLADDVTNNKDAGGRLARASESTHATSGTPIDITEGAEGVNHFAEGYDETCQLFFLLDGRPPIELPETWGEARAAFKDMCVQEGYSSIGCSEAEGIVFAGYPKADEVRMDAGQELCARLMAHAAAVEAETHLNGEPVNRDKVPIPLPSEARQISLSAPPRRAKGIYTPQIQQTYPRGYLKRRYGYSGKMAYLAGSPFLIGGVLAGGYLMHHSYSRYHDYCNRPGMNCDCQSLDCNSGISLPVDANRDDLTNTQFTPQQYQFPLTLTIRHVGGIDFFEQKICPPHERRLWDYEGSTTPYPRPLNASYTGQQEDLFVAVTRLDSLSTEGGEEGNAVSLVLGVLVCFFMPMTCIYYLCFKKKGSGFMQLGEHSGMTGMTMDQIEAMYGGPCQPLQPGTFQVGARVTTQHTLEEGGDGLWYFGTITDVQGPGQVTINYDDGSSWQGGIDHVYLIPHSG